MGATVQGAAQGPFRGVTDWQGRARAPILNVGCRTQAPTPTPQQELINMTSRMSTMREVQERPR